MTKILIIEDNENNARLMNKILSRQGYDLTFATNAVEGLLAFRRIRPHLILLDVGLPDVAGTDIARQLKFYDGSREPVLVGVTADNSRQTRDTLLEFGCEGVIHKPIDTRAFADQIASYLPASVSSNI
jgi:CheY-like chemotaxis protein